MFNPKLQFDLQFVSNWTKLLRNKTFIMKTTRLTDRDTIAVLRTVENACYM